MRNWNEPLRAFVTSCEPSSSGILFNPQCDKTPLLLATPNGHLAFPTFRSPVSALRLLPLCQWRSATFQHALPRRAFRPPSPATAGCWGWSRKEASLRPPSLTGEVLAVVQERGEPPTSEPYGRGAGGGPGKGRASDLISAFRFSGRISLDSDSSDSFRSPVSAFRSQKAQIRKYKIGSD